MAEYGSIPHLMRSTDVRMVWPFTQVYTVYVFQRCSSRTGLICLKVLCVSRTHGGVAGRTLHAGMPRSTTTFLHTCASQIVLFLGPKHIICRQYSSQSQSCRLLLFSVYL